VTAAVWLKGPAVPFRVFSTEADAVDWLREVLTKDGVLGS
jgi:hypothetical protein